MKDITLTLLACVTIVLLLNSTIRLDGNKIRYDYYLQLDKDAVYLIDKKGDTIHREQMNWDKPNQLQQSLIKDNL